jgi:hypothetical protein
VLLLGALVVACGGADDETDHPTEPPASAESPTSPDPSTGQGKTAPPPFHADFSNAPPAPSANAPAPSSSAANACVDTDDPGADETVAKALPDTNDCIDDHQDVHGVLKSAVDVDFYKLEGTDEGISLKHPFGCRLDTDFSLDAPGAELCVFLRCKNSTADAVTGCAAGTPATSDIGMKGCCANAPGRAVPQWDCSGLTDNDSADIFIRVRPTPNAQACLPYDVSYRF